MKNRICLLALGVFTLLIVAVSCNKPEEKSDVNPPFIVMQGDSIVWAELGKPYVDAGASAYDVTSEKDTIDISLKMVTDNKVNTEQIGSYKVTYSVTDDAGNKAPNKVRTVYVNLF